MPRGDKSPYSSKQKPQVEYTENSINKLGKSNNTEKKCSGDCHKQARGGKKSSSGLSKISNSIFSKKGGRKARKNDLPFLNYFHFSYYTQ